MNEIRSCSLFYSTGAVYAEKFMRSSKNVLRKPEKRKTNWLDETKMLTKKYKIEKLTSSKLVPIQGSLKKKRHMFTQIYEIKDRKQKQTKVERRGSVMTADRRSVYSKGDTTN